MSDLVLSEFVKNDGEKVKTTSLVVADKFDREHRHILESVRNMNCSQDFYESHFRLIDYKDSKGRTKPCYEMTRDGFMFLAMGLTGERAGQIKEAFIKAFNLMERTLASLPSVPFSMIETETNAAMRLAQLFGFEGNQAKLSAAKAMKEYYKVDVQSLIGATHLISESQEAELTPTELGKKIGLSAQGVNKLLAENNLQEKVEDKWIVTSKGRRFAVVLDTGKKHSNGAPVQQIKWKESVIEEIKEEEEAA